MRQLPIYPFIHSSTYPSVALPFVKRTIVFLYPLAVVAIAYIVCVAVGFNVSNFMLNVYFGK